MNENLRIKEHIKSIKQDGEHILTKCLWNNGEHICKFRRPKKGNRIVETAKIVQTNFKTTLRNVKQSSQNGIKSFLKSYLKFFVHSPKSHDIFSNMMLLMKTIPINWFKYRLFFLRSITQIYMNCFVSS